MIPHILKVLAELELLHEKSELRQLGLSEEEIDGCIDFFIDHYPELEDIYLDNKRT